MVRQVEARRALTVPVGRYRGTMVLAGLGETYDYDTTVSVLPGHYPHVEGTLLSDCPLMVGGRVKGADYKFCNPN